MAASWSRKHQTAYDDTNNSRPRHESKFGNETAWCGHQPAQRRHACPSPESACWPRRTVQKRQRGQWRAGKRRFISAPHWPGPVGGLGDSGRRSIDDRVMYGLRTGERGVAGKGTGASAGVVERGICGTPRICSGQTHLLAAFPGILTRPPA